MPKPSLAIARQLERLTQFRDLFQQALEAADHGELSDALADRVSVAAGEARRAYAVNDGRTFAVQEGMYVISNADPLSHWSAVFDPESDLIPMKVLTSLNLAIGRAQERYEEATRSERGVVGVLASIIRWPSTLRDAVGPSRAQRRAAQTLGVVGQVVVAAIAAGLGTALGAAIIQGSVLLWQSLFGG